jgi:hypothetical protein
MAVSSGHLGYWQKARGKGQKGLKKLSRFLNLLPLALSLTPTFGDLTLNIYHIVR